MKKRLQCTIVGRVQMVMFRDFTARNARTLGLVGEVWNERDGSVSLVAEGEEQDLRDLLVLVKKGPILAHVERVDEEWGEAGEGFEGFHIVYDR